MIIPSVKRILKPLASVYRSVKDKPRTNTRISQILDDETKYTSDTLPNINLNRLTYEIRMQIHRIEKAVVVGKYENARQKVDGLLRKTQTLLNNYPTYPKEGDLVIETLGILEGLKRYFIDDEVITSLLDEFIIKNDLQDAIIRPLYVSKVSKNCDSIHGDIYEEFVKARHSIRDFLEKTVDFQTVEEIVKLAQNCPSACNRQSCKVYYTMDSKKLALCKPDALVNNNIHNYLIVTVNKSMYTKGETFTSWIDGGIFLESLIMAIHSKGLGCCPFQMLKNTEQYNKIKKIATIPENEDVVAMVGFGYLKDEYFIIETHRKPLSEVLIQF